MEPQIIPFEETNHLANLQSLGSKCQISGKDTFFFFVDVLSQTPQQKSTAVFFLRCWSNTKARLPSNHLRRLQSTCTLVPSNLVKLLWLVVCYVIYQGFQIIPESKNLVKVMGWKKENRFETKQGVKMVTVSSSFKL